MLNVSIDKRTIVIVCGPTASGKSDFALNMAQIYGGEIICADAMQLYKDLPLLSAAPSEGDYKTVPHHLFQRLSSTEKINVFQYLLKANEVIEDCFLREKVPILVGGTGFYIKAVMEGISPMPEVPLYIREKASKFYDQKGPEACFERLQAIDSTRAIGINQKDRQRLIRALEVFEATGKPLSYWQSLPLEHRLPDARFQVIVTDMPRDILYDRCDQRLVKMIESGVLDELKALLAQDISAESPVFRILGARELTAYLKGQIPFEKALEQAQQATRNYAKRQITWFKHQINKEDQIRVNPLTL